MQLLRKNILVLSGLAVATLVIVPQANATSASSVDPLGGAISSSAAPGILNSAKQAAFDSMSSANNKAIASARQVSLRAKGHASILPGGDGGGGWGPGDAHLTYYSQFQTKSWYCVPASVRTAISVAYLKAGKAVATLPTQDSLATALGTVSPVGGSSGGTNVANVPPVLNNYQTNNIYIFDKPTAWGTFAADVQLDVGGYTSAVPVTVNPRVLPWDYPNTLDSSHEIDTVGFHYTATTTRLDLWDPEPIDTSSAGAENGYTLASIWTSMTIVPGQTGAQIVW